MSVPTNPVAMSGFNQQPSGNVRERDDYHYSDIPLLHMATHTVTAAIIKHWIGRVIINEGV